MDSGEGEGEGGDIAFRVRVSPSLGEFFGRRFFFPLLCCLLTLASGLTDRKFIEVEVPLSANSLDVLDLLVRRVSLSDHCLPF